MSMNRLQLTDTDHIPEEFTAEDLAENGFTPEEIAALSTGSEEDPALFEAPKPEAAEADANADAEAAQQIGAADASEQEQAAPAPEDERIPHFDIPDTTEAEKVIADLDSKLEALSLRYDDGELTAAEMREQTKALIAEQAKAQIQIEQARTTVNNAQQTIEQRFFDAQDAYYKAGAAELMSQEHQSNWDRHLREVTGNPAYSNLTMRQWIELAHRRYADEYQVINGKALPIPLPKAAEPKAKLTTRTDERPEPLQTLANVNGDMSDAVRDSRAAQLDRMAKDDPLSAEEQLGRMSDGEEDNWLRYA